MLRNRQNKQGWVALGVLSSLLSPPGLAQDAANPVSASTQANTWPAARQHVKSVDGTAYKYTSKLKQVVELNFTLNFHHDNAKSIVTQALKRIGAAYGFSVKSYVGGTTGTVSGQIPDFTLENLLSGEVIVSNNVSHLDGTALGLDRRNAIKQAIESDGRGYLGFHGSCEHGYNWAWYSDTLFPLEYKLSGDRISVPVYKHLEAAKHIILENTFDSGMALAQAPNELNDLNQEIIAENVPVRMIKNETYGFLRDISRDSAYRDRVTMLLKFDARNSGPAYSIDRRRKGGNIYTFLYQVGHGMTSYIPAGHANDEVYDMDEVVDVIRTGFDGGVGDFDRYVAQTLFFLAGYTHQPCDSSCKGLPLVDDKNHSTGEGYGGGLSISDQRKIRISFASHKPEFTSLPGQSYQAQLVDIAGQVLDQKSGHGQAQVRFEASRLKPGIYFLRARIGAGPLQSRRYVLTRG